MGVPPFFNNEEKKGFSQFWANSPLQSESYEIYSFYHPHYRVIRVNASEVKPEPVKLVFH